MAASHESVIVNLIVKATDKEDAHGTVAARLNKWLMETGEKEFIEGFGYPFGSLLFYGFVEKEAVDNAVHRVPAETAHAQDGTGGEGQEEILTIQDRTHSG